MTEAFGGHPVAAPLRTLPQFLEAHLGAAQRHGFFVVEAELHARAAAGEQYARENLAAFYSAHDLHAEALAALGEATGEDRIGKLVRARSHFLLGRDARCLEIASERTRDDVDFALLEAAALARLGAYREAAALFRRMDVTVAARLAALDVTEMQSLAGEAMVLSQSDAATVQVKILPGQVASWSDALALRSADEALRAREAFARLGSTASEPLATRAMIALHSMRLAEGEMSSSEIAEIAKGLALRWRGGAAEREALELVGEAALASGDMETTFDAWRRVVDNAPRSDLAYRLQERLGGLLPRLLDDENLNPRDAARLFAENVDLAPPGEAGDRLVREFVRKLTDLGLAREGAELLEHQVFRRLRGAERSRVAADLAGLRNAIGDYEAALSVLRSTRFAGLDEELIERRRLLEADALSGLGRGEEALALLAGAKSPAAVFAQAEIYWRADRWSEAGEAYADAFVAFSAANDDRARLALVRAGAAFGLASDMARLRRLAAEARARIGDAEEVQLIEALDGGVGVGAFQKLYLQVFSDRAADS